MKSKIAITNINNINSETMEIIDSSQIHRGIYDWLGDLFIFEDRKTGKRRYDFIMSVSVQDDFIVAGGEKFQILEMLSKNNF